MTVLGLHVCGPDRALAWIDSETLAPDGAPIGHVPKLAVNVLAHLVGLGTGRCGVIAEADALVHRALGLDELLPRLGPVLRQAALRHSAKASYAICGFSHRLGRLAAFLLDSGSYFEPVPVSTFSSPHADELACLHPVVPEDIAGLAVQQMLDLHQDTPHRGGGILTTAVIGTNTITVRPLLDFSAGFLRRPGSLSTAAVRAAGSLVRQTGEPAAEPMLVAAA